MAAEHFAVPESRVGAIFCRLHRQKLIERGHGPDGRITSWVNQRGVDRVAYWLEQDAAEAAEQAPTEQDSDEAVTCPR